MEFFKFIVAVETIVCFFGWIFDSSEAFTTYDCSLNINEDLGTPQPLYLYRNTSKFVTTETGTSAIHLIHKEQIELFCSNGFRSPFENETNSNKSGTLFATCLGQKKFLIGDKTDKLSKIACHSYPNHSTIVTARRCLVGNLVEIGFNVNGIWIPVLEVCHDNKTDSTLWVRHELKPNNANHQRSIPRILFIKGHFYQGIRPDYLYSKITQQKTLGHILESQELAEKLIKVQDSDLYLARGHLAAKADYVFAAHQLATFYYINAAPQWQSFNGGNWLAIKTAVKKIIERNIEADVYTGTHGVVSYPDINGIFRDFYLYSNDSIQRIPVPRFYFKAVIEKNMQTGIVFIGINDPHLSHDQIDRDYIICPDVSDKVNYVDWHRTNITAGYSYACSVNDFAKVVNVLPPLPSIRAILL